MKIQAVFVDGQEAEHVSVQLEQRGIHNRISGWRGGALVQFPWRHGQFIEDLGTRMRATLLHPKGRFTFEADRVTIAA